MAAARAARPACTGRAATRSCGGCWGREGPGIWWASHAGRRRGRQRPSARLRSGVVRRDGALSLASGGRLRPPRATAVACVCPPHHPHHTHSPAAAAPPVWSAGRGPSLYVPIGRARAHRGRGRVGASDGVVCECRDDSQWSREDTAAACVWKEGSANELCRHTNLAPCLSPSRGPARSPRRACLAQPLVSHTTTRVCLPPLSSLPTMVADAATPTAPPPPAPPLDEDAVVRHRLLSHTSSARGEPPLKRVTRA